MLHPVNVKRSGSNISKANNIIIEKLTTKVTILPHGTTIETISDQGHIFHRVCDPGGDMCRYTENQDTAQDFAAIYEEIVNYK